MNREARTEALLQINTTYRRFMIGSSVVIFVSALYFMMHTTYSVVIAVGIGAPPSVLLPLWIDRKLLKLDLEHVTSNMLAKANREKLKRHLDGIND